MTVAKDNDHFKVTIYSLRTEAIVIVIFSRGAQNFRIRFSSLYSWKEQFLEEIINLFDYLGYHVLNFIAINH